MKAIKKVGLTPVQSYTGKIIDSFDTSSDKHTNAPSINAVENYVGGKIIDNSSYSGDKTKVAPSINNMETYVGNAISNIPANKKLNFTITNKDGSILRKEYNGSEAVDVTLDMSTGMTTLTGSVSVTGGQSAKKLIDFPAGYTKDNCVAIAVGHKISSASGGFAYGTPMKSDGNPYSFYVRLGDETSTSKIAIHYYDSEVETNITINYKIVLMQI